MADGCLGPILLRRGGEGAGRNGNGLDPLDVLAGVSAWWGGFSKASLELLAHMHIPLPALDDGAVGQAGSAANCSGADAVDDTRGEGCGGGAAVGGAAGGGARCLPSLASCLPLGCLWGGGAAASVKSAAVFTKSMSAPSIIAPVSTSREF